MKVVLITNIFPYSPGEEFIETEIKYWAKRNDVQLTLMPKNETNSSRVLPNSIVIDEILLKNKHLNKNDFATAARILTSSIFYKEIFNNLIFNPAKLKHTLIACRDFLFLREKLKEFIQKQDNQEILFYSYWHTEVCYALQSLKSEFTHIKVISRIHGFDLYQERRPHNYMPLKKQFLKNIDTIYTISEKNKDYLINTYNYDPRIIEVSRLGVNDRGIITSATGEETLHLVSCSYLSEVKRIDKIIDALSVLSAMNSNVHYRWTHIGDGDLYEKLLQMAKNKLKDLPNVSFEFKGHLDNKDVYRFYEQNEVDVFINVSELEGVPVTIMEAMSCHIPVIAPNVGGISEMIENKSNGMLLSNECKIDEIITSLKHIEFYKDIQTRESSYQIYLQKYNSNQNYNTFIKNISKILKKRK